MRRDRTVKINEDYSQNFSRGDMFNFIDNVDRLKIIIDNFMEGCHVLGRFYKFFHQDIEDLQIRNRELNNIAEMLEHEVEELKKLKKNNTKEEKK